MSVGSLATETLVVRRKAFPKDGGAAAVATIGTIRARVQPAKGTEPVLYGKDTEVVPVVVYVEGRPDVRIEDVLVVPDGSTLFVRSVTDVDLVGVFTTIVCERQS